MNDMEHPVIFFEELILDSPIFTRIHDALTRALDGDPERIAFYRERLRKLEEQAKTLDWLADRARRLVYGDVEAQDMFCAWLDCCAATDTSHPSDEHTHHHSTVQEGEAIEFPVAPIIDILMGAAYAANGDHQVLHKYLATVRALVAKLVAPLGFLDQAAQRYLQGVDPSETLTIALEQINQGLALFCKPGRPCGTLPVHDTADHHATTSKPQPFSLSLLDMLLEKWAAENPVSLWLKYSSEDRNNASILRLSSDVVRGGQEVTLFADPTNPFDAAQSPSIGVFAGSSGVACKVKRWSSTEVSVDILEEAVSGCVYFGRTLTEDETKDIDVSLHHNAKLVGKHWHLTFLSHLPPTNFVRPPHCFEDDRNCLRVLHKPAIVSFEAFDATGKRISDEAVEAGANITLKWTVFSDDPASLQVSILSNGQPVHTALPSSGSVRVVAFHRQTFGLHVTDLIDTDSRELIVNPNPAMLKLSPQPLTVSRTRVDALRIELPNPNATSNVEITLTTSDDTKVVLLQPIRTVFAGQTGRNAAVVGGVDTNRHPGQPAATITASAPGYSSASVDAWLENSKGQWTEMDIALDLVPVHAALLRNGKVLFFSWDEDDFKNLKRGKSQVWDPETGQPAPLLNLRRNVFCSGHCFLPDGRLLVAGGKNGGAYVPVQYTDFIWHEGPDRDLQTVRIDSDHPSGVNWDSHESCKEARWYPTCVTLADGRALIVGGSRSGSNQASINKTYEIFEPAGGEKSDPVSFGKDAKVYPFLMVLPDGTPEGTLFVHRNHETWLRRLATNRWVDKTFHTNLRKGRTYNHQGSCVLLPVRGSGTARLLVVGGDGGDDEATNTAEIFEFNPGDPKRSKWRKTTNLRFKRFMSDAVLLPDGTILVVNGAAKGAADEAEDSVKTPELFNPDTETWETLAPAKHARHYHSVGILLPDGRVLVSGNTRPYNPGNPIDNKTIEIFSPPYLFRGPQPVITWAPARVGYDDDLFIETPDAGYSDKEGNTENPNRITSVVVVRASSVTHSNNMDQRYLELTIIKRDTSSLTVKTPTDGTAAPPGYYMVFILNRNGVPSKGKFVRIS